MHSADSRETRVGPHAVRVVAASRLTFSLIDLNGELGRRNGVASLALADPGFEASLYPSSEFSAKHDGGADHEYGSVITTLLSNLRTTFSLSDAAQVVVHRDIPKHSGFGSKTAILMAVGRAYGSMFGKEICYDRIANLAKRGGTSGAGVNLISCGGFVIDGGHANPEDFDLNPQKYLIPSAFAPPVSRRPPVLINLPFPTEWPIVVIEARGRHLSGKEELEWFQRILPIPLQEVQRIAHLMLMGVAPAIAERDYGAFCRAINRITFDSYYKGKVIEMQSEEVRMLLKESQLQSSIDAIGVSSTGPTCFAFTNDWAAMQIWLAELQGRGVVDNFYLTTAHNGPLILEKLYENSDISREMAYARAT